MLPTVYFRTMDSACRYIKSLWNGISVKDSEETGSNEKEEGNSEFGKPFESIPGPKGLPWLGTALEYMKINGLNFEKMFEVYENRYKTYGPIFKENIGHVTNVVVTDFKEYKKVMRAEGKMPGRVALEPLKYYRETSGLEPGMVNSNGDEWFKYRSAIQRKMLQTKEVLDCVPIMNQVTDDLMVALETCRHSDGSMDNQMDLCLFQWATEWAAILGIRMGCLAIPNGSPLGKAFTTNLLGVFDKMQQLMYSLPLYKYWTTPTWAKFKQHCDICVESGMILIEKKMKELTEQMSSPNPGGREDVLEVEEERICLLEYLVSESSLNMRDAASIVVEVMLGAVETATNTILWTLFCLSYHNPTAQDRLFEEIDTQLVPDGPVTTTILSRLPFLKSCLKETLRLFPITFATSRITSRSIEVCGYHIPPETHIQANTYTLCHDSEVFPEPYSYRPERWLNPTEDMGVANLVWGHGPRMCIGKKLAEQEISIALIKIIHKYKVTFKAPATLDDIPKPILKTVLVPDRKFHFTFTPREFI